jgi:D-xylose transport system substrate-binding protein
MGLYHGGAAKAQGASSLGVPLGAMFAHNAAQRKETNSMDVRNILMVISLGLSVTIGLVIARGGHAAGTAGTPAGAGGPLIGLSLDTLKEPRWQSDRDRFRERCEALGAKVLVEAANSNDAQQANDVQSLLSAGVKVLVIVAHDGQAMSASVSAAHAAGVVVIAYDRMVMDCPLDLYISFDNVRVGRQQAQYLVDHLPTPGHGKIVRIYGAPTDNNAKLFKQGQDEVLKPYLDRGDIVVVHEDWAEDWKPENAKRIMNAAITKGVQFDAVLASNDGTAGGAIKALSENGLAGKTMVTGQDADLDACQRIASGTQTMTIYKPVKQLATLAAETAVAMADGRAVVASGTVNNGQEDVPSLLHDVFTVTKENMMDTVVKDGFHGYDEIYADLPAADRPARPQ